MSMLYANNKGADQPAHPRSLISTFVIRCLNIITPLVSISAISILYLAFVARLCLTWLRTPKTGFLMMRLICGPVISRQYMKAAQVVRDATFQLSHLMTKPTKWLCAQQRLGSAWASTQSDQSLCCVLNGSLRTRAFFMRTSKTLIRLGGCPGWSESLLGAHAILLVLSWGGSVIWSLITDYSDMISCKLPSPLATYSHIDSQRFILLGIKS